MTDLFFSTEQIPLAAVGALVHRDRRVAAGAVDGVGGIGRPIRVGRPVGIDLVVAVLRYRQRPGERLGPGKINLSPFIVRRQRICVPDAKNASESRYQQSWHGKCQAAKR